MSDTMWQAVNVPGDYIGDGHMQMLAMADGTVWLYESEMGQLVQFADVDAMWAELSGETACNFVSYKASTLTIAEALVRHLQ